MVVVIHHPVVCLTNLDDLFDGLVLGERLGGNRHSYGEDNPNEDCSFHFLIFVKCDIYAKVTKKS